MEEEKDRRKANIIIHGLQEPTAAEADDRKNEECDRVHAGAVASDCL